MYKGVPLNFVNEILHWPYFLANIGGLWPFYLEENPSKSNLQEWKFRWRSLRAVYVVLMPCLAIFTLSGLWIHASLLFGHVRESVSLTESSGHAVMSTLMQVGVATIMGSALVNRKGIAETWSSLNKLGNDVALSINVYSWTLDLPSIHQNAFIEWIFKQKRYATMATITIIIQMLFYVLISPWDIFEMVVKLHGLTRETINAQLILVMWLMVSRLYATFIPILLTTLDITAGLYHHLALDVNDYTQVRPDIDINDFAFRKSCKSPLSTQFSKRIEKIMQIGDELEQIMEKLNNKLKVQIMVILMIVGINLVFNTFSILMHLDLRFINQKTKIAETVFLFIDAIMFCAICSSASSVSHKATAFGHELGKIIDSESFSPHTQARIRHTALKLTLKPPVFSPGYIVIVNNSLLSSFVTMVTTYLIVLLQFAT